jgi:translation initiation factor 2 subunit 2
MSLDYEKLLDRALDKAPKKSKSQTRFEIPAIISVGDRSKTIITNFQEIAERLNREPKQILKFFLKELATSGSMVGGKAIFQGRFNRMTFNRLSARLLSIFVNKYIICPICKSPDTKIIKKDNFTSLICEACGARSSIIE